MDHFDRFHLGLHRDNDDSVNAFVRLVSPPFYFGYLLLGVPSWWAGLVSGLREWTLTSGHDSAQFPQSPNPGNEEKRGVSHSWTPARVMSMTQLHFQGRKSPF